MTDICEDYGVTKSAVSKWVKKGMPCTQKNNKEYEFNMLDVAMWHQKNIGTSPLKRGIELDENMAVEDQLRVKRMEKLDLEMAITRGEYIPIDEVDEVTARMLALLINQYRQHMRVLPNLLQKKSQTQIKKALDKKFGDSIIDIKKVLDADEAVAPNDGDM